MRYAFCDFKILEVLKKCQIHSFPVDCERLLDIYCCNCIPYSSLSSREQLLCHQFPKDAVLVNDKGFLKLFYDDSQCDTRIRFSWMHGLGHFVLGHLDPMYSASLSEEEKEQEANYFASNLLAPHLAIYYSGLRTPEVVADVFSISNKTASYALKNFYRWFAYHQNSRKSLNFVDFQLHEHLYPKEKLPDFSISASISPL
ncbi:MAG: ImmA/IrrE family metallo-endopeptidase [Fibrobacter sp.]|nr:ImmA/IrrE family metallo-endopeptidase [Fibrobacter sp.]